MSVTRREFLGAAALSTVAGRLEAAKTLPTRPLGRTGENVTILGFGSGSRFLQYEDEDSALHAIGRALELGVRYFDTAHDYGKGLSEERVGKGLGSRRGEVFLTTKLISRTADEGRRDIETSLKRLRTDHVDLLHIHDLKGPEDLAAIEAPGGILEAVYEAREQGTARFVGITCHADPAALRDAIDRHDFDCTQFALNAALARMEPEGWQATRMETGSFESLALPVARRKGMGVLAMKVFVQDQLAGRATPEELLRYALTLPVSAAVVGMPKLEHLEQNAARARGFQPLAEAEMERLRASYDEKDRVALRRFFRHHRDA